MSSCSEDDGASPEGSSRIAKKRRIARACDLCRRRKVKCDGNDMPGNTCSNCMADKVECAYIRSAPKRGPTKTYVETLEKRALRMEKYLRKALPKETFDKEFGPKANFDLPIPDLDVDTHEVLCSPAGADAGHPFRVATSVLRTIHGDAPVEDLADELSSLNLLDGSKRYFGKSSGAVLVQTTMMAKGSAGGGNTYLFEGCKPPQDWECQLAQAPRPPYEFPPHDLMLTLIDLFFEHHNSVMPFLHRPTFDRQISEDMHLTHPVFGANVLMICASGARYSDDPRVFLEEYDSPYTSGWKWFRQVRLFRDAIMNPPGLLDLQFYVLAVIFICGTTNVQACWTLIGLGIRLGQDVGADRRKGRSRTVEDELWKRVWWALIVFDRLIASGMGRQAAMKEEDFDQDLPIDCDDEYWEHPDPHQAFRQPLGKPSKSSAFIHMIGLIRLLGMALRTIYCTNKARFPVGFMAGKLEEHIVTELDSALNRWLDNLPDHLRWDPRREDPVFFNQSVLLYTSFYAIQITIHRPFIPTKGQSAMLSFPSMAICTNAARSCARTLEAHRLRSKGMALVQVVGSAFTAAVVLLLSMWSGKREGQVINYKREMADVQKCVDFLSVCEERSRTARRFIDCLTDLASLGDLPMLEESSRGRKRAWSDGEGSTPSSSASPASPPASSGDSIPTPSISTSLLPPQVVDFESYQQGQGALMAEQSDFFSNLVGNEDPTCFQHPSAHPQIDLSDIFGSHPVFHDASTIQQQGYQATPDPFLPWGPAPSAFAMDDWSSYMNGYSSFTPPNMAQEYGHSHQHQQPMSSQHSYQS